MGKKRKHVESVSPANNAADMKALPTTRLSDEPTPKKVYPESNVACENSANNRTKLLKENFGGR